MRKDTGDSSLIFPDLSYKIVGAAFSVFKEIGYGLPEKIYQRALEKELQKLTIPFKKEVYLPLQYRSENIGKFYADFVVDKKIIIELKVVKKLTYSHAKQLLAYLHSSGIKLGILIYFTSEGVKFRRVINSSA